MKKLLLFICIFIVHSLFVNAQQCLSGGCTSFVNEYPSVGAPYTPNTSWQVLTNPATGNDALMNGGNWTRFNVTLGTTYEWTYCEDYGGVSTSWDAQLTLFNNANPTNPICFSTDVCGTNNDAPYISWTATFTGVARILTTAYSGGVGCQSNSGTYNKLSFRKLATGCTTPGTPASATGSPTGQTSANLSWSAGSPVGSPVVTYYWVVGTSSNVTYGNGVAQGTTNGTTVSTSALACGTSYYLRVYAYTSCNGTSSGYRTSPSFTTSACSGVSIYGIDVSHHQGSINWTQVYAAGKVFAFVKATEGVTYNDSYFTANMTNGSDAGVVMGAYHVARPDNNSAVDEANHFLSIAGAYIGAGYLPPALDLEPEFVEQIDVTTLTAWIQTWMTTVQNETGVSPIIYCTHWDAANIIDISLNIYGLWIANYENNPLTPPTNLGVWSTWVFNQYSQLGTVSGISGAVDLDIFNGDITAFNNLINSSTISVITPNGSENWTAGTTHLITWSDNIDENVKIQLYKGGSLNSTITNSTASDGSYSWTVPTNQTPGNDYRIKITSTANNNLYDFSDDYFTVATEQNTCVDCPTYDFIINPSSSWLTHSSSHVQNGCKMYRISVNSDETYTFKTGCGDGATANYDTYLELYNSSCALIMANDDECESNRSKIEWTATYTGYAYLKVKGFLNGFGNYTLAYIKESPLTSPSWLTAVAISSSQINVSWENVSNEDGYRLYRALNPGGSYSLLATLNANVTSYSNTGLNENTEYCYKVRAYNAAGNSGYSPEDCAITQQDISPPAAPSWLTATATSVSQINISWENVSNEDGYRLYRALNPGGSYSLLITLGVNVTSYSNTGLSENTEYCYKVKAYNASGNSLYSPEDCATTQQSGGPPSPPTWLTATAFSDTQIDISWEDVDNENGYRIYRALNPGSAYSFITNVGANITTYSNTGLDLNTQYCYKVKAYNASGNSSFSPNDCAITGDVSPPAAPSWLTATATSVSQINISWEDVSNEDGYRLYRALNPGGSYSLLVTLGVNVTSYSNTGLSENTEYCYKVRAYNASGNSAYSPEDCATTQQSGGPPSPPTWLTASAYSDTQIDISWEDVDNENGYRIYRALNPGSAYSFITNVGANITTYSNTGLDPNTQYCYKVKAYNASGNSSFSPNDCANTNTDGPPVSPSWLIATATSVSQINLSWENVSNEDGYRLYRALNPGGSYSLLITLGVNVTSYSNTGLSENTEYCYKVKAYNASGNSLYSPEDCATTQQSGGPPSPPTWLTASAYSDTQIDISWEDVDNENGYRIYRALNPGSAYSFITNVGANITTYSNTGLDPNTQYCYKVKAYNASGNSSFSPNDCANTNTEGPPIAPGWLTAEAFSSSQIDISWEDVYNEDGYGIYRALNPGSAFSLITNVDANITSYSNTGLDPNTQYCYKVKAFNALGNSSYSPNDCATTNSEGPPESPSWLTATAFSSSQIDISWENVDNENGYRIYRALNPGSAYSFITNVGANITTYSNTGLDANTQYCYKVKAYNASGNSNFSPRDCATTSGDGPPVSPSWLDATASSVSQINVSWEDVSNEDGYRLYRALNPGGSYSLLATLNANVTSYSNSGLNENTEYCYKVKAYNASGNSAYSPEDCATTLQSGDPPSPPSWLTATPFSDSQINISWENVNNEDGYRIYRALNPGSAYSLIASVGVNITTYSNTGLDPNTQYCYKVKAYNASGNSNFSPRDCTNTESAPFANPLSNTEQHIEKEGSIRAYTMERFICIESSGSLIDEEKDVFVFDLQGGLIVNKTLPSGNFDKFFVNTSRTILIVKIVTQNSVYTTKLFIR